MGAMDFEEYAVAKTATEAFRQAREDALYEYGHRGYTGSMAEKHSFRQIPVQGSNPVKFVKALKTWGNQNHSFDEKEWLAYWDTVAKKLRKTRYTPGKYVVSTKNAEGERIQSVRTLKGFKPPACGAFWEDKWNDAACVDLGPATKTNIDKLGIRNILPQRGSRIFVFFGWASS